MAGWLVSPLASQPARQVAGKTERQPDRPARSKALYLSPVILALKLSLPTPNARLVVAAVRGRCLVKGGEAKIEDRTNEAHTPHTTTTHTQGKAALLATQIDRQRLLAIFNRHPNFYDYGKYAKTFRYAATPHAFCILAVPRSLKMACSQPRPGQAPKSLKEQTAMGSLPIPANTTLLQDASLQAPPLSGSGLGQGK